MTTLLGFAAIALDLGYLYVVRTQLQAAADAAALAGTSTYFENAALTQDQTTLAYVGRQRAQAMSLRNVSMTDGTILDAADVAFGRHDFANGTGALLASGRWNGVEVTVRCTPGSSNGAVRLFFANIFGIAEGGVAATARAAVNDQFAGYRLIESEDEANLLPFTILKEIFDDALVNGPDDFSYDGQVRSWGDQIPEIRLYPWKWNEVAGDDGVDGSGNFGTLNVGIGDQGTAELERQIAEGITAAELEAEFGTFVLMFYGPDGQVNSYPGTGNPGISVGLRDAVQGRIGDVVGFFIHRSVVQDGSNATYDIVGIRFGRIMYLHLTGNPKNRALVLQPVVYTGGSIIVEEYAAPSGGIVGRPMLVR